MVLKREGPPIVITVLTEVLLLPAVRVMPTRTEVQTCQTVTEKTTRQSDCYTDLYDKRDYLNLVEWSVADINGDLEQCGLSGSRPR